MHVALERRQENLRRVAEHDDAERDGESEDVDAQRHLGPAPAARLQETIAEDHHVDDDVSHRAPEAQRGYVVEILQKGAR